MIFLITSCGLFETREPEEPDTKPSSFIPPTEPEIVISNFANAFIEKNTSNYILCFSDTSLSDREVFEFIPTAAALSQYPSLFIDWDINSERQYFNSFALRLQESERPKLNFSNMEYDKRPDSVIFVADYIISIEQSENLTSAFAGTLQLTIAPKSSGMWSIRRWRDAPAPESSNIKNTWSNLKAIYYN